MMAKIRAQMQLAEAVGPVNRWYCSEAHRTMIEDEELLLKHFIKHGGATDFARRYEQAMGRDNRWYCSQHHCQEVSDPVLLWNYYMSRFTESVDTRLGSSIQL